MRCRSVPAAALNCLVPAEWPEPDAVPLVLVHGAGGSAGHWRWVLDRLPADVAPIAVDLPGHGDSPGTVPASVAEAAAEVRAAVRVLIGDRPFALAGHSMGGLVALWLAATDPAPVTGLALVATAARITAHPRMVRQWVTGSVDEEFVRRSFSAGVPEDRIRVVLADLAATRVASADTDYLGADGLDLTDRLDRISAPAVVLIADRDPVVSPRRSRAMAAAIPRSRTVLIQGGHYLHVEQPDPVGAELARICGAAPVTAPAPEGRRP